MPSHQAAPIADIEADAHGESAAPRTRRDPAGTRRRILAAAIEEFSRGGFAGARVDVGADRRGAGGRDRQPGGHERLRGHDDLVARADAQRAQRERERVHAAAHPDGVQRPAGLRPRALEGLDLRAQHPAARAGDPGEGLLQLGGQLGLGRAQIEERDA